MITRVNTDIRFCLRYDDMYGKTYETRNSHSRYQVSSKDIVTQFSFFLLSRFSYPTGEITPNYTDSYVYAESCISYEIR